MIKYFAVENFKSIKNKAILEFDSNLAEDYPYPASAVIGFAGANASGKTTILQAIRFAFWFMQKSFSAIQEREAIPCHPFVTTSNLPSKFHLIFTQKNSENKYIDYEYLLTVNQERVLKEEVYYYPNNSQEQELVYERKEKQVKFGENIHVLDEDVTSALPSKSSIISFFSQFPSQTIAKKNYNYYFASNNANEADVQDFEFNPLVIPNLKSEKGYKENLINVLKIADIGIEEINFKTITAEEKQTIVNDFCEQSGISPDSKIKDQLESYVMENYKIDKFMVMHKIDNALVDFRTSNERDYLETTESAGTLKLLALFPKIQMAFREGYLLIIDEIELRLHQNLVAYLIGLFENPSQNLQGGQLLFSFHNTALMEILQPNQLWFTEKNDQGQTEIFSAADFTDIKDLYQRNLEELYRIGRFGAKPRAL